MILDKNDLKDEGIKELANCFTDRFQVLNEEAYGESIWMPLVNLSISKVKMTDNGFKYLI